jgi:choline-sulfatase
VIVFSSDHGELNGDCGLIYKETFLNGAVRVPLLVRTPETVKRQTGGRVADSPVEWFDIGPTLVELAGGEPGHRHFARSLCPVLEDVAAPHRDFAVSEVHGEIMYLDKKWKMALNAEGLPYLLFDIENDPQEQRNLAGDASLETVRTELRLRLQEHLVRTQIRR